MIDDTEEEIPESAIVTKLRRQHDLVNLSWIKVPIAG